MNEATASKCAASPSASRQKPGCSTASTDCARRGTVPSWPHCRGKDDHVKMLLARSSPTPATFAVAGPGSKIIAIEIRPPRCGYPPKTWGVGGGVGG